MCTPIECFKMTFGNLEQKVHLHFCLLHFSHCIFVQVEYSHTNTHTLMHRHYFSFSLFLSFSLSVCVWAHLISIRMLGQCKIDQYLKRPYFDGTWWVSINKYKCEFYWKISKRIEASYSMDIACCMSALQHSSVHARIF